MRGSRYVTQNSMLEGRAGSSTLRRAHALAVSRWRPSYRGFVGREQIVFVARVHSDHLAAFYPLLRDVLLAPSFDDGDVERVRTRAIASLTQDLRGGDDEELGKQTLQAMLYEGTATRASRARQRAGAGSDSRRGCRRALGAAPVRAAG